MRDTFLTDLNEVNDQEDFKETQICVPIMEPRWNSLQFSCLVSGLLRISATNL